MFDLQEAIIKCADVRQWVRRRRPMVVGAEPAMLFFRLTLFDVFSGARIEFSPSGEALKQFCSHAAVSHYTSQALCLFADRIDALLLDPLAKNTVSVRIDEVKEVSLFPRRIVAFHTF